MASKHTVIDLSTGLIFIFLTLVPHSRTRAMYTPVLHVVSLERCHRSLAQLEYSFRNYTPKFVPSNYTTDDNRMAAILGTAVVIAVIAACTGPFYYCKQPTRGPEEEEDDPAEDETQTIRVKISRPCCNEKSDGMPCDACDNAQYLVGNSVHLAEELARKSAPLSLRVAKIMPVQPPRRRRGLRETYYCDRMPTQISAMNNTRSSTNIWSSAMRLQLENIINSASEVRVGTPVATAQVAVHSGDSSLSNDECPNPLGPESPGDSDKSTIKETCNDNEKGGKLSQAVGKKWKSLKKSLIPKRSRKTVSFTALQNDETQRLSIPVLVSNRRSPVGHSTMLHRNRLVDASTSTKISRNVPKPVIPGRNSVASLESNDRRYAEADFRQDRFPSLMKNQSSDGKSICDLRITGLALDQSELLDLFEATGGKPQSASIITTEEASVIAIKFHRNDGPRRASGRINDTVGSPYDCARGKLYKTLTERLEDMTLLRSKRPQERSLRSTNASHFVHFSDRPGAPNSPSGESSYMGFRKTGDGVFADRSLLGSSFWGRFNGTNFSRFFQQLRGVE